ncbi:hypothetical protein OAM74_00320 [Gammaproteobacteria bacterium]|nr:hypothetical protein [Gammaproteobacteria bacterium]
MTNKDKDFKATEVDLFGEVDEELKESIISANEQKKTKRTVDLFGEVDIELKEKIIAANNTANEIRKSKRRKAQKEQEKKNEKNFYEIFKDNFYSALKETKKYLLWGRHTSGLNKSKYVEGANKSEKKFFSEDLEEREGWKYNLWFVRSYLQGSIHSSQNKRFFEIKWTLPLYEDAMGYIPDKCMIHPNFKDFKERNFIDFEEENDAYMELIQSCRKLLDPELRDDYFLKGIDFNLKKGFKKINYPRDEDLRSMSLTQHKNVLIFQWKLPEEIIKIRIANSDEFRCCFQYWMQ